MVRGWTSGGLLAFLAVGACTTLLGDDYSIGGAGDGGGGVAGHGGGSAGGAGGDGGAAIGGGGGVMLCGNDTVDDGETCDGDCPSECIDPDLCTNDILEGAPSDCNVTCTFEPKVTCKHNDGCCPSGCHQGNDNECDLDVIVIANDGALTSVVSTIAGTGAFDSVVAHNVQSLGMPTPDTFIGFEVAFVYTNISFPDAVAMGDMLADFHDGGGRVVTANGANCNGFGIQGRFVTDGYMTITAGDANPNEDAMVPVEDQSPLLAGVGALTVTLHCDGVPTAGSVVVASLGTSGDPLITRGEINGRRRVDLNLIPYASTAQGDLANLLRNALWYQ